MVDGRVLGVVGAMVIGSIGGVLWVVAIIVGGVMVIVVQVGVVVVAVGGGRKGRRVGYLRQLGRKHLADIY